MGTISCFQCINSNQNTQENFAQLNVDISPDLDQYMNFDTKVGTFGATYKRKKSIKIDKGDFIRIKSENFY